jgi:hypothetical protein
LKGICPANQNVHGGERLILFQIGLFSWLEETHVYLEENNLCKKWQQLAHCFPVRIELDFEGNPCCNWGVTRWWKTQFPTNRYFHWVEDTHLSLQRKRSMLEAAESYILLPGENCMSFWKENFLWIIVFKVWKS